MKKINLIIVDDSVVIRRFIGNYLADDPQIAVIATAVNGKSGLAKIHQLKPDIVVLDIEMPEMDGLEALIEIRKSYPNLPVIMFSSLTHEGALATLHALSLGANDYVTKSVNGISISENLKSVSEELIYKIKGLVKPFQNNFEPKLNSKLLIPGNIRHNMKAHILAIGTSTGGPNALKKVIPAIAANFPVPIVIVQHMPPVFTKILADSLSKESQIPVVEAVEGEILLPGKAYIAPGGYHMTIVNQGKQYIVKLNQDPPENFCRPSVDALFRSLSHCFGGHTLAVVMTGMGQDGLKGCHLIKKENGQVIAQDEATSVVWGMPGSVATAGLADEILPLNDMIDGINQRINWK